MATVTTNAMAMVDPATDALKRLVVKSSNTCRPPQCIDPTPQATSDSTIECKECKQCPEGKCVTCGPQQFVIYFIRHGEALHNRLEKEAQAKALSIAVAQGHDPNSDYARECQEKARKAVLHDDCMEDPPLTERGIEEAKKAKRDLERLIDAYNLPPVQEVWVSPLQRALKTAAVIFPNSCSSNENLCNTSCIKSKSAPIVRVRKELEERKTGYACDRHAPVAGLVSRHTFHKFSFSGLKLTSVANIMAMANLSPEFEENKHDLNIDDDKCSDDSNWGNFLNPSDHERGSEIWEQEVVLEEIDESKVSKCNRNEMGRGSGFQSLVNQDNCRKEGKCSVPETEDKAMLRERTKKLFHFLMETDSRSIALIGHKGYLRELERGQLGHTDAELFENCEVRVYRIELDVIDDGQGENADNQSQGATDHANVQDTSVHGRQKRRSSTGKPVVQIAEKIASSRGLEESTVSSIKGFVP